MERENNSVKSIESGKLYSVCNKYQFFTSGTNNQYAKMFDLALAGVTKNELALILYICSVHELADIYKAIDHLFEEEK